MLARVGGFSARLLRPMWVGPLVFAALLAFAAWAVSLSVTVRGLRDDVERRVSWLRAVTEALAEDDGAQRADNLRIAFAAMATDEGALAELGREGTTRVDEGRTDDAWLAGVARTLRGETGRLSSELGDRWSELSVLVVIALFLAWMLAALYVVARRQVFQLDALRADLARRLVELGERDQELALRLAELEDRDRTLRTIAASVVHEINNPLTYVSLNLSTVRRELEKLDVPADVMERLVRMAGRAVEGADRVAQITRDLRDLTLPDSSETGPVELRKVLTAAARLSNGRMQSATLTLEIPDDLPSIPGDARRLEQVFLNLLINAADACRERGHATIVLRASADDECVSVEVEDEGEGIASQELDRVFDPFFTTKGEAGTGLGLYVAKHVVESHGGLLVVDSRRGEGTTVRVVLPIRG